MANPVVVRPNHTTPEQADLAKAGAARVVWCRSIHEQGELGLHAKGEVGEWRHSRGARREACSGPESATRSSTRPGHQACS